MGAAADPVLMLEAVMMKCTVVTRLVKPCDCRDPWVSSYTILISRPGKAGLHSQNMWVVFGLD